MCVGPAVFIGPSVFLGRSATDGRHSMNFIAGSRRTSYRWPIHFAGPVTIGRPPLDTRPAGRRRPPPNLRQETAGSRDAFAAPARMLERRALAAARRAPGALPQLVTRRISAPPDDGNGAGERGVMRTLLAIDPHPRGRAVQVAEGRP